MGKPKPLDAVPGILPKLGNTLSAHPVILLGGKCQGSKEKLPEAWLRLARKCVLANAYVISRQYAPTLLQMWEDTLKPGRDFTPADISWMPLMEADHWAITNPSLMEQGMSYSDIGGFMVSRSDERRVIKTDNGTVLVNDWPDR